MKTRRFLSLILALTLCFALAVPASAADLTYAVTGGSIYFDANTGTITGCDSTVTRADIPSEIYGVPVTAIGIGAFDSCSSLTAVTIPSTVTSIGGSAFLHCTSLTSIVIPDSVTQMGSGIFRGCGSLQNVTLSRNLTEIPAYAFYDCGSLTGITIPDSVTSIGERAFAFSGLTSITVPDSVTTIGGSAFAECDSLTSADLGSVSSIGTLLFERDFSLAHVTLSSSLTELPNSTFSRCTALEELVVPEGVTTIGQLLFFETDALRTITLPSTLQHVESVAFDDCVNLTDVYYNGTAMDWAAIRIDGGNNRPLTAATIHFAEPVAGFTDVSTTDYYGEAVQWAVNQGVTGGTSETTFSPADTVTRAQAVTFLWRAAGSPAPAASSAPFADVTPDAYYYQAVLWAAENGITGGVGENQFGPEQTLAYDQIFTFISHAVGESGTGADWSEAAVNWARESGLTDGLSFSAKDSCPRADVIYCLWKRMA